MEQDNLIGLWIKVLWLKDNDLVNFFFVILMLSNFNFRFDLILLLKLTFYNVCNLKIREIRQILDYCSLINPFAVGDTSIDYFKRNGNF